MRRMVLQYRVERVSCYKYGRYRHQQQQQQTFTSSEPQLAEKQKKAEYAKQYRLKHKLLVQQQASTSSETELVRKQKSKCIPSIFNDESTESFIRVTCICVA
jgi:hypothetical protein